MKFEFCMFCLLFASCANPLPDPKSQSTIISDTGVNDNVQEIARKEFILSYSKPLLIDTTFIYDNHPYKMIFRHYCLNDFGLAIPAKYNFDTGKDFITNNFKSEITLVDNNDTVFKKEISKQTFRKLLTPQLDSLAVLLAPNIKIYKDTIEIRYSISIPATDLGIPAIIKFDKTGNAIISD